ncbi:MAG: hypothetical protein H6Q64_399 [Firmicutes bacterium]|nr:hypothetical protein [Bacillota bacterium]
MKYVLPFHFMFEHMKRLAVISFKGDEEFEGYEPQFFDDPVNGKGIRLLRYRNNGKVDVYYENSIIYDESFSIGAGIEDCQMIRFDKNIFEINAYGLQIHLAFTDAQGRKNELKVQENSARKYPVPFLAPVGAGVEKPPKLFFVYMNDFDFAYRKTTQIHCSIDSRILEPATIPFLIGGHRIYLARYCSRLNIVALNPDHSNPFCFDSMPGKTIQQNEAQIHCNMEGKVEQIQIGEHLHSAILDFPNGFPNLLDLPENQCITGSFDIYLSSAKITGGQYLLEKTEDQVRVKFDQFKQWQPGKLPWGYKLLMTFLKFFRNWPTSYSWEGTVDLAEIPLMEGNWQNRRERMAK